MYLGQVSSVPLVINEYLVIWITNNIQFLNNAVGTISAGWIIFLCWRETLQEQLILPVFTMLLLEYYYLLIAALNFT